MAWITPVTDRANGQTRTTAEDMNRIAGNINELQGTSLKADYTSSDIVTRNEWRRILEETRKLNHFGLEITDRTDYQNLNNIEKVLKYNPDRIETELSFQLSQKLGHNLFKGGY